MNEKIEAIYKEIANKELSFGCRVKYEIWDNSRVIWKWFNPKTIAISYKWTDTSEKDQLFNWNNRNNCSNIDANPSELEIIWHDVMIWDVLDWSWIMSIELLVDLEVQWKHKRLPIEKQTEKCIDYVLYNLIKTWKK